MRVDQLACKIGQKHAYSKHQHSDDDSQIEELIKNEAKQLGKLKNEYRIV
jgi:hypothetical protein